MEESINELEKEPNLKIRLVSQCTQCPYMARGDTNSVNDHYKHLFLFHPHCFGRVMLLLDPNSKLPDCDQSEDVEHSCLYKCNLSFDRLEVSCIGALSNVLFSGYYTEQKSSITTLVTQLYNKRASSGLFACNARFQFILSRAEAAIGTISLK
jgi:hypothetical protein